MHDIERHVIISLPMILGVDLSITNEVILVWLAAIITFSLVLLSCRRRGLVAVGVFENMFEGLIEYIENRIAKEGIGDEGRRWAPFLLTLFFFILFGNLLGMVPMPSHFKSATANINVTTGLALIVFFATLAINIRHNGMFGFFKKFLPEGLPRWIAVMVVPIEIVSWLVRPLSLAIRLFANMATGHALILVFIGLLVQTVWFLRFIPLAGAVVMSCFELFVCFIQAFIFTMLAGIYIREAVEAGH